MESPLTQAIELANREFIKGFIFGQVILCLLIFFLLKTFLLKGSQETRLSMTQTRNLKQLKPVKKTIDSFILSKTKYAAEFESLNWLNVFLGRILSYYRDDLEFKNHLLHEMDSMLNSMSLEFLGPVSITEFHLGDEFPIFKNAIIKQEDSLVLYVDFTIIDQLTIGFDTSILINWPKTCIASLPVSLILSVICFSGTLRIQLDQTSHPYLLVSVLDNCILDLEVNSLLGHHSKVKDLSKLTTMIVSKLKNVFVERWVWPKYEVFNFF